MASERSWTETTYGLSCISLPLHNGVLHPITASVNRVYVLLQAGRETNGSPESVSIQLTGLEIDSRCPGKLQENI